MGEKRLELDRGELVYEDLALVCPTLHVAAIVFHMNAGPPVQEKGDSDQEEGDP